MQPKVLNKKLDGSRLRLLRLEYLTAILMDGERDTLQRLSVRSKLFIFSRFFFGFIQRPMHLSFSMFFEACQPESAPACLSHGRIFSAVLFRDMVQLCGSHWPIAFSRDCSVQLWASMSDGSRECKYTESWWIRGRISRVDSVDAFQGYWLGFHVNEKDKKYQVPITTCKTSKYKHQ